MSLLKLKSNFCKLNASQRLYGVEIPIVGLTGGIATGKSTASELLIKNKLPVINADALVKTIYKEQSTLDLVSKVAPQAISKNQVDFKTLRAIFFKDTVVKIRLEEHIYSLLPDAFKAALKEYSNPKVIIYDVPLLFEKNLEKLLDYSALVYCSREEQIKRLISRDSIDEELAQRILSNQLPIDDKKKLADYIIDNSKNIEHLEKEIKKFINEIFEIV